MPWVDLTTMGVLCSQVGKEEENTPACLKVAQSCVSNTLVSAFNKMLQALITWPQHFSRFHLEKGLDTCFVHITYGIHMNMLIPLYYFQSPLPCTWLLFYSYILVELAKVIHIEKVSGGDLQQGRFFILGRDPSLSLGFENAFWSGRSKRAGRCSFVGRWTEIVIRAILRIYGIFDHRRDNCLEYF